MKKLILIAFLALSLNTAESSFKFSVEYLEGQRERQALNQIINAVIYIESRGNNFAIGAANDLGCLQVTPIRLRDYNQRTGSNYKSRDLFSREISIEIFTYYAKKIGVYNFEEIAKCWNGGPNGYKIKATEKYWTLIKEQL
jgi:soluble lytic murein transglycosylase-like protein